MKITVKDTSTNSGVFVKGSDNHLAFAVFYGYVKKDWNTAGHVNLGRVNQ